MPMDLSDLCKVWEVKPLKMTGENEARKILENVVKQVQPILRKHKWKVEVLSEFSSSNPSHMGLNIGGGAEIKLRLRRPERKWDFFSDEQVLDTMLHELCHNEHGPHNADFYKLFDELRQECEESMARGTKGAGRRVDLSERRMGGSSQPPPLPFFRQNAWTAAERRAQHGTLLPSGPRNIGGNNSMMVDLTPVQAAAMVSERRLRDDLWCGTQSLRTNGQEPSNNAFSSVGSSNTASSSTESGYNASSAMGSSYYASSSIESSNNTSSSMKSQRPISSLQAQPRASLQSQPPHGKIESQGSWQCSMCTLINKPLALACEACQTLRTKKDEPSISNWSCKFCTLMNKSNLTKCSACGEPRKSYGPPSSYTPPEAPAFETSQTPRSKRDDPSTSNWSCKFCTLINNNNLEECSACGEPRYSYVRPPSVYTPPEAPVVETFQTPRSKKDDPSISNWSCKFCTLINNSNLENCSACGEQRYSYGPPASSYTPPTAPAIETLQMPRGPRREDGPSVSNWSCKLCTLINDSNLERCSACGEQR
ncbi:nuclear pore complex protein Nup153-like [Chenopodium quinoa]|uniref:Uncharacterized protein n=1 Tax=Chenopodium quinoa TaxID=63459 RepID=A0A803KQN2_CHEQI|nr:nuclear pore complex protein Nup153-like [Chenopodium quinoa]